MTLADPSQLPLDLLAACDQALAGKVALVTGAGRGIGRGAAIGLARRGARVMAVALEAEELEHTANIAAQCSISGELAWQALDLRDSEVIDTCLEHVKQRWGDVDILINNAAMLEFLAFEDTTPARWRDTLAVNLEAAYYLAWRCYPLMQAKKQGVILTVSSGAATRPFVQETAYCASKYALEGLFKSLALEALPHKVLVMLATPGKRTKPTSMLDADYQALSPQERQHYADALDFANGFAYLAAADDLLLAGKRFDLNAVSALVRQHSWQMPVWQVLQQAERGS